LALQKFILGNGLRIDGILKLFFFFILSASEEMMDLVSAQPSRIRGNEIMLNWQQKNKIKSDFSTNR